MQHKKGLLMLWYSRADMQLYQVYSSLSVGELFTMQLNMLEMACCELPLVFADTLDTASIALCHRSSAYRPAATQHEHVAN